MYPKSVKFLGDYPHKVLKQSKNKKLSKDKLPVIKKGEFKGYVIYTLTLEERATCTVCWSAPDKQVLFLTH